MTNNELIRFAAEKVGVEIAYADDGLGWQYMSIEHEGWWNFDLTSPDLFFKGLVVCHHYTELDIFVPQDDPDATVIKLRVGSHMKMCESPSEIPQKFWECWAEVEGETTQ